MAQWLLANEVPLRLGSFAGLLMLFAFWEQWWPIRARAVPLLQRRLRNGMIILINAGALRLLFIVASVTAVGFAAIVDANDWGLLNAFAVPPAVAFLIGFLLLDLIIWAQHVAFHHIPAFWRLHRVHHMDLDLDVTSGLRFHPLEIVLSMGIKFAAILVLGVPAVAVLVFEVVLNATSMFNHSNIKLPPRVDRVLRLFLVTPNMHWVHHSVHRWETDSNFGFNLPWWDRLFGTYRPRPQDGYHGMTIGLPDRRDVQDQKLLRLLVNPFERLSS